MSKHTPGPWFTAQMDGKYYPRVYTVQPNEDKPSGRYLHINCAGNMEEHQANARLIAASPRLLAALKAIVKIADRDTAEFTEARAAIAEAEGNEV